MEDRDFDDFVKRKVEKAKINNLEKFATAEKGVTLVQALLDDFNSLIIDMRTKSTHEMGMQFLVASLTATIMTHSKNLDEAYQRVEEMKNIISKQEKEYHTADDS